jgi:uncharacterized protein (UPF0276 family)
MLSNKMILSTNLSPALLQLLKTEAVLIDAIEVGPWFSVDQLREYQEQLSDWQFYFHPSNWTSSRALSSRSIHRLNTYLQITQSPWASVHIAMLPMSYVKLAMRYGIYLPPPPVKLAISRLIKQVKKLQSKIAVPVILENMPAFPTRKYFFESDPGVICRVLAETGCQFLLDLSHARVAAAVQGVSVREYLLQLPLARVVQIHASGPRERDGVLYDAHEPLTSVDYELLAWVLERTQPQVLTLEYFKDKDQLREQLAQLARMIE